MCLSASGELAQANRGEQGMTDLVRGIQASRLVKASGPTDFYSEADATVLQSTLQLV